jgi:hypothetical protein
MDNTLANIVPTSVHMLVFYKNIVSQHKLTTTLVNDSKPRIKPRLPAKK